MCFDGKTLSAYVDGELEGVQYSKIDDHLLICSPCREKVNLFESFRDQLKISEQKTDLLIKDAVWARLVHSTSASKELDFWHRGFIMAPSLMVSLSFLFLAVVGISVFLTLSNSNSKLASFNYTAGNSGAVFNSERFPVEIPFENIEKVLAYFNIHDEPLEVSIKLPDPSNFVIQGEPLFLKKVDYLVGR